jgi:tetratricopeptide (TPR) repeat protein
VRRLRGTVAVALLLVIPAASTSPGSLVLAQEEEDLTQNLRAMRAAYDRARESMDDLDFNAAIKQLQGLIEPRRNARPSDLTLEEIKVLCAAYDLRARALFNQGNTQAAQADFESLLKLDASYLIDRQTLSPKVVGLFDQARRRLVGVLYLSVEPQSARVLVDGDQVDARSADGIGLYSGTHDLRVEMEGYDPYSETVGASGGSELRRSVRLRPNRRTLEFITVPAGVTVSIDGRPAGVSAGPPTAEVEALAAQFRFDPQQASAPIPVPLIAPGEHKVTFDKDCFTSRSLTVKVELDAEQNRPLRFAPVLLEESRSQLQITSVPSGAEVLVDGVRQGTTPVTLGALCGGERDVSVIKADVGRWNERVRMTAGQVNTLTVRLRPTLLYAGTFRLDEWGRAVWSDEDKALLEALGRGLKTLNIVRMPQVQEEIRKSIIRWMISDPREVTSGTILSPDLLKDAAARTGADLVLAGLTFTNDPNHSWTLALYSPLHGSPDIARLRTDQPDQVRSFVERLDSAPQESDVWWGMTLADSGLGSTGPVVVRVLPGSPAAKAGLRIGDRIQLVATSKVQGTRDALAVMEKESQRKGGVRVPVVLSVDGGDSVRTVRLAAGEAPSVIPLTESGLLYNRALAEFRLRARAATEDTLRGVAHLNLGIALMHFRAYDKALSEGLSRADLPQGSGIAAGTVQYYRGLCALRRGDPEAARTAFQAASRATGSTLESADGPSASAAAARALQALQ